MAAYLNEAELLKLGMSRPTVAALRDTQRQAIQATDDALDGLFEPSAYVAELAKRLEDIAAELATQPNLGPQVAELQKVILALTAADLERHFNPSTAPVAELHKAVHDLNVLGAFTL